MCLWGGLCKYVGICVVFACGGLDVHEEVCVCVCWGSIACWDFKVLGTQNKTSVRDT